MPLKLSDWDHDLPIEEDEEYQAFIRTLRFTEGFGLLFVRCSPAGGEQLITKVKEDINDKIIEVIKLDKDVTNLYEIINKLDNKNQINILFITGLESALYKYEECKALTGWTSKEKYSYSWEGVPPLLININQQRERFRDSFNICFIFLLPQFAIKYFIHRAPDFFDWRSGLFEFPLDLSTLEQESNRILEEGDNEEYLNLTDAERIKKNLDIQELLEHQISSDKRAKLFFKLGKLQAAAQDYQAAISSYDQALKVKPDYELAWYNRGNSLRNLGRDEEAISSYDQALKINPNDEWTWNNRGISLKNLGKYEEAISSYDQALKISPDDEFAWYNRGNSLRKLGRHEEAISSYDQALKINPDERYAWSNRGNSLDDLGRYEEAISSFEKAFKIKPDDEFAWYNQGFALRNLGRYKEAISSFEKAFKINPHFNNVWYNIASCYALQGNIDQSIENLQTAINFNPDKYREKAKTNSDFDAIREDERFQALIK